MGKKLPDAGALEANSPLKPNQKAHYNYPELWVSWLNSHTGGWDLVSWGLSTLLRD